MIRATKPVRRIVFGGNNTGDLVVEVRNDVALIKPKGKPWSSAVRITWNNVYQAATRARTQKGGT